MKVDIALIGGGEFDSLRDACCRCSALDVSMLLLLPPPPAAAAAAAAAASALVMLPLVVMLNSCLRTIQPQTELNMCNTKLCFGPPKQGQEAEEE